MAERTWVRESFASTVKHVTNFQLNHADRAYLHCFGSFQGLFRGDPYFSVSQQLLNKVCYISSRNWNVFDTAADDIPFSLQAREQGQLHFRVLSGVRMA